MSNANGLTRQVIEEKVVQVLADMVRDWDLDLDDPISAETKIIGDLAFESIDLVQLTVAIEKTFNIRGLPYEEMLMEDGHYITEITVSQVVDFLDTKLNAAPAA
jgi:acyl carrier protein